MTRSAVVGLLAGLVLSASGSADELALDWPNRAPATEPIVAAMDDDDLRAYVRGTLDMAFISLVQMSFNESVPTATNAHALVTSYSECFLKLSEIEPHDWLARSRKSGLRMAEVILDAAIEACVSNGDVDGR